MGDLKNKLKRFDQAKSGACITCAASRQQSNPIRSNEDQEMADESCKCGKALDTSALADETSTWISSLNQLDSFEEFRKQLSQQIEQ